MVTTTDMYRSYTESAGKYCRQLALISIALIWLLHTNSVASANPLLTELNCYLKLAFFFTFFSLFADLVQEALCSYLWKKEFETNAEADATECSTPISAANILIVLKLISMAVSYICLGLFVFSTPMF